MTTLSAIMNERRQLLNLAYRMLGSLVDAEDVVQETYTRWYAMSRAQQEAVESPGASLTTVASRICLNLLGSARARRETYVGEWIPEPLPDPTEWIAGAAGGAGVDPADRITLDESVTMAFLIVFESMTSAERVAFVLHDVYRYPFAEVGEIVGRSPAARRRIAAARAEASPNAARQASVVRQFKAAWEAQDIEALLGLLDPGATAISGGRRPRHRPPAADRGRTADRRSLPHDRPARAAPHDPGAHGQRTARPGDRVRGPDRHGVRVRGGRRRPHHAHLDGAQPGQAPPMADVVTGHGTQPGPAASQ
jgi:RNA polymerase sigma factor (sigma-70 family)